MSPEPKRPWSLRGRLGRLFLLATAAGWLASAGLVFVVAERESSADNDLDLQRVGRLMLDVVVEEQSEGQLESELAKGRVVKFANLDEPGELLLQVIDGDGKIISRSENAPEYPLSELRDGFSNAEFGGSRWRVAAFSSKETDLRVLVARSSARRMRLSLQLGLALMAPVLIGLPLTAFAAAYLATRATRPIVAAAAELTRRGPDDLRPIVAHSLPREVDPLVRGFNRLLERVDALVGQQRRFASRVAHELRTPLAALRLDLQQSGGAALDTRPLIESVDRAVRVIEQLLALSRLELRAATKLAETPLGLGRLILECANQFSLSTKERGISIEFDGEDIELMRHHDAMFILLRNLIENAVRHAGSRVRVRAHTQDTDLVIEVEDDGPGFGANGIEGALGLGWDLVQGLASALEGRAIRGHSASLGGAMVSVIFPVAAIR